jgi:hypothetical protein
LALAASVVAGAAVIGVVYLKTIVLPQVDQAASARNLWTEVRPVAGSVCVGDIHRSWKYGLNYYSEIPLPDCRSEPAKLQIDQHSGTPPRLQRRY